MAHLIQHVEEGEKSLRDYASQRSEDFDMQKSDSVLRATEYEMKPQIIKTEFRYLGLDGIFSHTHLRKKREDGLHLHPSR